MSSTIKQMSTSIPQHRNGVIAFINCYRKFLSELSAELKPIGLGPDGCLILFLLSESSHQTTTQLAETLGLNLPTATKLIDRLVSDNLLHRKPHPSDRRQIQILLTKDGAKKVLDATDVFENFLTAFNDSAPQIAKYIFQENS